MIEQPSVDTSEIISSPSKRQLSAVERVVVKWIPVGMGFMSTLGYEIIRADQVNPRSDPTTALGLESTHRAASLSAEAHPLLFSLLSHGGDLLDGYYLTMVAKVGLEIIDTVQSRITNRSIPDNIKLPLSMLLSCGAVTAVEAGLLPQFNGSSELADIPAGILGSLLFAGSYLIGKRLVEKSMAQPTILTETEAATNS